MSLNNSILKEDFWVDVPQKFMPIEQHRYPVDNDPPFEEWFRDKYSVNYARKPERLYLPILWTGFLKNNNYGQTPKLIEPLQEYVDSLSRKNKYFTVVQFDLGCMVDFKDLDIKVFSMAGPPMHYPLPLICKPHSYRPTRVGGRKFFASFMGRITHPIRQKLVDRIKGQFLYHVDTIGQPMDEYCDMLANSIFTLCPRGYSANSFRIMEAIQYGSIPVYISDEFIIPHGLNFRDFGVTISDVNINLLPEILKSFSEAEIKRKQEALPEIFRNYYTYEANQQLILQNLK